MKKPQQYDAFVDKFKPRHTSDDTHTPPNVYEAVLAWCERRYRIDRAKVLRPFCPGGDYANADCPAGCVVIDNPPFSVLSQIVRFYLGRGNPFFLFAPSLTCIGHARHPGCAAIFSDSDITFDNGAVVRCAFLTSLEPPDVLAVSAPDLGDAATRSPLPRRRTARPARRKSRRSRCPTRCSPARVCSTSPRTTRRTRCAAARPHSCDVSTTIRAAYSAAGSCFRPARRRNARRRNARRRNAP